MSVEEIVSETTAARLRLDDCEQRFFSGAAHLDELRQAYLNWQTAERRAAEARAALAG